MGKGDRGKSASSAQAAEILSRTDGGHASSQVQRSVSWCLLIVAHLIGAYIDCFNVVCTKMGKSLLGTMIF